MVLIFTEELNEWILGTGRWINKGIQTRLNREEVLWGNSVLNNKEISKMWSAMLGEEIVRNLLEKKGKKVWKPKKLRGLQPDLETDEFIYEVKTRNWTTTGTAGEKILGVAYKYANVPELYGKRLLIVVVGYQEYEACKNFDLFEPKSVAKQKQIQLWKEIGIEFVKCSDLM